MNGELSERRSDVIGHPFRLSGFSSIQLSWRFASPDPGFLGRLRFLSSQLDLESIASGTNHRKGFALMSQSHQMTLARLKNCADQHTVEGCDHLTQSVSAQLSGYSKVRKRFCTRFGCFRAVRMFKSALDPCLIFGSRILQNSCTCTSFNYGGEMHFTIQIDCFNDIFQALTPST